MRCNKVPLSQLTHHICTALSISGASSNTTRGLLPPSSSDTRLRLDLPAACIINLPTSVEPVNATYRFYVSVFLIRQRNKNELAL